jgi:hypothetical protein
MEVSKIIAEIDAQISKLQQARELLAGTAKSSKGPGRPKGSKNLNSSPAAVAPRKRKLSAEGRKRISEAMKRRHAERRKFASKTLTSSK